MSHEKKAGTNQANTHEENLRANTINYSNCKSF